MPRPPLGARRDRRLGRVDGEEVNAGCFSTSDAIERSEIRTMRAYRLAPHR